MSTITVSRLRACYIELFPEEQRKISELHVVRGSVLEFPFEFLTHPNGKHPIRMEGRLLVTATLVSQPTHGYRPTREIIGVWSINKGWSSAEFGGRDTCGMRLRVGGRDNDPFFRGHVLYWHPDPEKHGSLMDEFHYPTFRPTTS
jgi:hypothetical protein